ncbi:MAG: hypothetical protein ABSD12_22870 [Paraburkholderia sp.]|jgi:hypothetical protein
MKLSTCLGCAALLLSVGAYAQTSQTFTFGEGQTTPHAANARPSQGVQPHRVQTPAKPKPKHPTTRQTPRPPQASNLDTYSHS